MKAHLPPVLPPKICESLYGPVAPMTMNFFDQSKKGFRMPSCVIAMPPKKPPTATKEASCPSPTRYQMPLPQPPASTIPMPKTQAAEDVGDRPEGLGLERDHAAVVRGGWRR